MAMKNKISKAGQRMAGKAKKIFGKRRKDKSGMPKAGKA